jgi:predicted Zn-dependent protease
MRVGNHSLLWLAAGAAIALSGCATSTITGRSQLMMVSEETAIKGSASAYSQMIGGYAKKKKIEAGTPRATRVAEITDRLIAQAVRFRPDAAAWHWEVQVIDEPKTVNAFCMAGGKMAIYTGLLEQLKATDDEIAQVMGHEIAHALANHTQERMSIAMTSQVGLELAAIALGGRQGAGLGLTGAQLAAVYAIQLPNSRESESEADRIGIELAARAGYDPKAAVTLWEKMEKAGGKGPPQFLSTHPSPQNRRERLAQLGPQMEPFYLEAKANPPKVAPSFLDRKKGAPTENSNERAVTRESVNERAVTKPPN